MHYGRVWVSVLVFGVLLRTSAGDRSPSQDSGLRPDHDQIALAHNNSGILETHRCPPRRATTEAVSACTQPLRATLRSCERVTVVSVAAPRWPSAVLVFLTFDRDSQVGERHWALTGVQHGGSTPPVGI